MGRTSRAGFGVPPRGPMAVVVSSHPRCHPVLLQGHPPVPATQPAWGLTPTSVSNTLCSEVWGWDREAVDGCSSTADYGLE